MKKIYLLLVLSLVVPFVAADYAALITEAGNSVVGTEIPQQAQKIAGNQRVNIYLDDLVFGVVTSETTVASFQQGALENPTLDAKTTLTKVKEIATSSSPSASAMHALDDSSIDLKAYGFMNKVKLMAAKIILKFSGSSVVPVPRNVTLEDCLTDPLVQLFADECVLPTVPVQPTEPAVPSTNENNNTNTSEEAAAAETILEETPTAPEQHVVELVDTGFGVEEINILVDESVEFKNIREGRYTQALILGTKQCAKIKSGFLESGESFTATFDTVGECVFVDGVLTTKTMKVVVSEE